MKDFYYKLLAYLFYYLGDAAWFICRTAETFFITRLFITSLFWDLYQWSMSKSVYYDEKIGHILWK